MMKTTANRQPWLRSASFDVPFVLLPGLVALLVTLLLPALYKQTDEMPLAAWVVLVLLVDVAHVYSTLFRTYLNKERFRVHRGLYTAIPIACFLVGVLVYSIGDWLFWRVLAYLAVYHFVRQQYGFLRLYNRQEPKDTWMAVVDKVAIYAATLYPIVYWHCTPGRNFDWFVKGDFMVAEIGWLRAIAGWLYVAIMTVWIGRELFAWLKWHTVNLPRILIVGSTALTWFFGIVYFNGDMAFTLLNVVAHGVPYMALIWLQDVRNNKALTGRAGQLRKPLSRLALFVGVIVVCAWVEEGIWDGMVWRERGEIFGMFAALPQLMSKEALAFLVPLLSLPQTTHYVLDGFIWKREHTAAEHVPA